MSSLSPKQLMLCFACVRVLPSRQRVSTLQSMRDSASRGAQSPRRLAKRLQQRPSATLCFRALVLGALLHDKCQQWHSYRWLYCRRSFRERTRLFHDTSKTTTLPHLEDIERGNEEVFGTDDCAFECFPTATTMRANRRCSDRPQSMLWKFHATLDGFDARTR